MQSAKRWILTWLLYVLASGLAGFAGAFVGLSDLGPGHANLLSTATLLGLGAAAIAALVIVAPILALWSGLHMWILADFNDASGLSFSVSLPATLVLVVYAAILFVRRSHSGRLVPATIAACLGAILFAGIIRLT